MKVFVFNNVMALSSICYSGDNLTQVPTTTDEVWYLVNCSAVITPSSLLLCGNRVHSNLCPVGIKYR